MRLFTGECAKIFLQRGFMLALAALLAINGFLLWRNEVVSVPSPAAVRALYADLAKLPDARQGTTLRKGEQTAAALEKISSHLGSNTLTKKQFAYYEALYKKGRYLKYTNNLYSEKMLYSQALMEYDRVHSYKSFLNSIDSKAEQMRQVSIFSNPDTFAYRNIQKTRLEMAALKGRTLTFAISNGVNMATDFAGTDLLAVLLLFAVCLRLVTYERDKGMCALTRTASRGRAKLMAAKLLAVAFSAFVLLVLFYAVNFSVAGSMFGFGDLSRTIQSVNGYNGSGLLLSVGQYIILYLASKYAAYLLCGLVLLLICAAARSAVTVYVFAAAIFGGEYALYALISQYGIVGVFKCINLVCFLSVSPLYSEYLNIDLFGYPVNVLSILAVSIPVLLTALVILSILVYSSASAMPRSARLHSFALPRFGASVRLWPHEFYKLLVANGALIVLAALIAIQGYSLFHYSFYMSDDDAYYRAYLNRLAGPVTQQKIDYLKQQKLQFEKIDKAKAALLIKLNSGKLSQQDYAQEFFMLSGEEVGKQAFENVMNRYNYIKSSHLPLSFVYGGGYERLMGLDGADDGLLDAIKLIIAIIGCFASVYAIEYKNGAVHLIRTCARGRSDTVRVKTLQCLALLIPIFAAVYLPDFINTCINYGIGQLSAPAASLPQFSFMPGWVSLLGFLLLFYGLRLFAAVCCTLLVLTLSALTRSTLTSLLLSLTLFAGPTLLSMLGFSVLDQVSLNALLKGCGPLLQNTVIASVQIFIPAAVAAAGIGITVFTYSENKPLLSFHLRQRICKKLKPLP